MGGSRTRVLVRAAQNVGWALVFLAGGIPVVLLIAMVLFSAWAPPRY